MTGWDISATRLIMSITNGVYPSALEQETGRSEKCYDCRDALVPLRCALLATIERSGNKGKSQCGQRPVTLEGGRLACKGRCPQQQ